MGMREIYGNYLTLQESPSDRVHSSLPVIRSKNEKLTIILEHSGDVSGIEALGFDIEGHQSEVALQGDIYLKDVAAISRLPNVKLLAFGTSLGSLLIESTKHIGVQSSTVALTNGIWHYDENTDVFTGHTGEGVIIGVIDSGIHWDHPSFHTKDGTDTRIISIWDQGLRPNRREAGPNTDLLGAGTTRTYGVEYDRAALAPNQDNPAIRSEDADGHGTHVASIAAGNGAYNSILLTPTIKRHRIGVAPNAELIIVKFTNVNSNVSELIRMRDAVSYILEKAAKLPGSNRPVVINGSIGNVFHPHDGRGTQGTETFEQSMHQFLHGQAGKIGVFAAGNNGGKDEHIKITIPASGEVELPFRILDNRVRRRSTPQLLLSMFYSAAEPNLLVAVNVPKQTNFFPDVSLGNHQVKPFHSRGFRVDHLNLFASSAHGDADRNGIIIRFAPKNNRFYQPTTGNNLDYKIRLKGPENTVIHLWHEGKNDDLTLVFGATTTIEGFAGVEGIDGVDIDRKSQIATPAQSPDVIAVANYGIVTDGSTIHRILNCKSSRGPLISYDGSAVIANKPDISAPGTEIEAAVPLNLAWGILGVISEDHQFGFMTGTSMSCPMIAGLVALLLEKNATLTKAQIQQLFDAHSEKTLVRHDPDQDCENYNPTDTSPFAGQDEIGAGRINAKLVFDNVPTP